MLQISDIESLHIELTTKCNARCPMCMRNYRGFTHNSGYPITELSLQNISTIFTKDFCSQIKVVQLVGNLGDFGIAKDAFEIVQFWLKNSPAQIHIDTNGSMRTTDWWAQLADPRVQVYFALDGLEDTHNLYRQGTHWQKIIKNATAFIEAGGKATWKFIRFKHNKHQEQDCKELSEQLGFHNFLTIDQSRDQGPVFKSDGEFSHWLGDSLSPIPPRVDKLLNEHYTWFDPKTVIATTAIKENADIKCEHLRKKELYISANGNVYPCCYLGYFPESMHQAGNSQIKPIIGNNNALEYPLDQCIEWFNNLYQLWQKDTVADGKPFICVRECGQCN